MRTSLVVQWVRLQASIAGGTGSIPGQGTKIPRPHTHLYETLLLQCITQYLPYMRYPVSAYLIIDMRNIFRNEFSQSEKRFLGEEGPAATAKLLQSCLTLCDPIDSSPPGFPLPGILQARTLEWVAISFSNA